MHSSANRNRVHRVDNSSFHPLSLFSFCMSLLFYYYHYFVWVLFFYFSLGFWFVFQPLSLSSSHFDCFQSANRMDMKKGRETGTSSVVISVARGLSLFIYFPTLRKQCVCCCCVVLLLLLPLVVPFHVDYLDYECAWSLLGGAGVLASPFQAMHGLASPLTAAYGSASVGGRHPIKTKNTFPHESSI